MIVRARCLLLVVCRDEIENELDKELLNEASLVGGELLFFLVIVTNSPFDVVGHLPEESAVDGGTVLQFTSSSFSSLCS